MEVIGRPQPETSNPQKSVSVFAFVNEAAHDYSDQPAASRNVKAERTSLGTRGTDWSHAMHITRRCAIPARLGGRVNFSYSLQARTWELHRIKPGYGPRPHPPPPPPSPGARITLAPTQTLNLTWRNQARSIALIPAPVLFTA